MSRKFQPPFDEVKTYFIDFEQFLCAPMETLDQFITMLELSKKSIISPFLTDVIEHENAETFSAKAMGIAVKSWNKKKVEFPDYQKFMDDRDC